ncbi:hypothetical protein JOB18_010283 [Solea senegalensis]|uniref:Uncharacterized protein n=1 Tax=Solea senegalensis TaxID=28829 RepID=A0AAV6R465_SOLSE|nr:uncharacterized protein si:ch211-248a14.8 isoform X1 [Solea senegalensis]XP_043909317.1 uncharacterized protein si:ch211-248a14.8 isoform X1 [Solea senegalensis]KAG7500135.1 hypothetical protein JOB18_010283 [Solea senegalensis]KAG7500136.1 hypothetical protein JOB18_010283 [Solea senegalensis]KAG7500138.1 hypothetical protein JOB18_010283 [Solea senegalensis]
MTSLRRWRPGRCTKTAERLLCAHALKPLVPALCLVAVVIYILADNLRNFVASIFIPQYHYPFAVALCFAQVLISLLILNLLHVLHLLPVKHYSWSLGERLLVPSLCTSIHAVLALWVRASSSYSGLFALAQPLLPLSTVGFSFVLKLSSLPSIHSSVLISILSGTSVVITVSNGLSVVEPLEYMYAPLALLLHSLSLSWLAKVSEAECLHPSDAQLSIFDIYHTQLVNQSWVLGVLWLLHPDSPWKVLSVGSWTSLLFHGYLLALLLLGMTLNLLVFLFTLCFSPLCAAMLHSAGQTVQPLLSLL